MALKKPVAVADTAVVVAADIVVAVAIAVVES